MSACVMCGNPETEQWTLDNGKDVYVVAVCEFHAAPLAAIGIAAGKGPGVPTRWGGAPTPRPPRKRRNKMEPLQWTKPE